MGSFDTSMCRLADCFSTRGQAAVELGSKRITWDIISDMWHPDSNAEGILSVGMAENTLLHTTLLEYINANSKLSPMHLTYNNGSMGSNALRDAVSHFVNRHFKPFRKVEPSHILMTNGCSSAIEHLSHLFLNPGEGILLGMPYYATFIADLTLRPEAEVVPVPMGEKDPLTPEAIELYEHAAIEFEQRTGKKIRAVMLCNPHNPLGRCYPRQTIERLLKLCQSRHMHLISDEIYALSTWSNQVDKTCTFNEFESLLSWDLTALIDPGLVHVLWGLSKDFGANGLRVGAIISQSNRDLHTAAKCVSLYSFISAMSDQIITSILSNDAFTDMYIKKNQQLLSQSHNHLLQIVKKNNIEYREGCNAGFFLWINLGKKYLENHPGEDATKPGFSDKIFNKLLYEKKVYVAHGTAYGSEKPGWYRVVFSHPLLWLDEAMERILSALQ
ncbi:aspartate aminotransferase [Penicillium atrosanguineum]|uniref:Aspartate aminotransferase n=1 Tax=Penicillium atrosanguineum TaxID=1132637 RepID=A0A9W9U3R9_9EURO|nr:aspartate aminotransferase [Penicillium atrosanguineum]KAJ5139435.1 aspartate aminotransferase [Penicillium atrosanguineum]KAJ5314868.1 aspartate aminotransferase [Penicillium atrosanguineum]